MNIGFIVGKDDELYDDEYLYSLTPKNIFSMITYILMSQYVWLSKNLTQMLM